MAEILAKRRYIEQKQAIHNAIKSVPFFISQIPTKIIAIDRQSELTLDSKQQVKIHFSNNQFIKTNILYFVTVQEAKEFYKLYTEKQQHFKLPTSTKSNNHNWIEYCKDLTKMENILYQQGKIYVCHIQDKDLREFLNDISQMVVVNGLFMEETFRKTKNSLFRFLDHNALSLEYIYYRWRTYAYLQNDGQKRYRTEPFRMVENGLQWYPPTPTSYQRGVLSYKKRRHFHNLLFKMTRKKNQIQQAMVFAVYHINCLVQIVVAITLQIYQKLKEDFIKYFYLISDILFNTTTPHYRKLFSRVIPFILYQFAKQKSTDPTQKQAQSRYKSQLKALIQIWEIKFIFDQNYTKGLLYILNSFENDQKNVRTIHQRLTAIGLMEDSQSQFQLERICLENGIPFIEHQKEESTRLINQFLWQNVIAQTKEPEINESFDGEPLTQKDILKIKNKQVKVICCDGVSTSILFQKNWQTKSRTAQSSSVDYE